MEATGGAAPSLGQQPPPPAGGDAASQPPPKAERLNAALQQQLNLESVKARALGLFKAISRILEDFDAYTRANTTPKWQDILGQFSMVNMELFKIVEDIQKVSKAFVVYPRNVNAQNAAILPVMLSSKLLPEMEVEDHAKRDQLLHGLTNLPTHTQIEKLKARIDMIGAACEAAEKVIEDARKAYGLGSRQGPTLVPTLDKVQAAKIQEQETLLRAAVNFGEGLRIPEQRQLPSSLPSHLVDVFTFGDGAQNFGDNSGVYPKNTPPFSSNTVNTQGAVMQTPGAQLIGRSAPSPSGVTGTASFDNASTPPLPYTNSPRSSTNMMNTPSPQQQTQPQHQRPKMMQIPQQHQHQHQQQLHAQQQLRQSPSPGVLGQSTVSQLNDMQGQTQQKFQQVLGQHQMQYSQPLSQQFQNRQLQSPHMQHNMAQNQINQGTQLRNHLSQFSGAVNNAIFNAAQSSPNSQMITNMSATMQSPSLLPRMQFYGMTSGHPQRNHPSQMVNDQMFSMNASNPASMVAMQQQQHGTQGGYGNIPTSNQNMQPGMVNFPQQRQQNQQ